MIKREIIKKKNRMCPWITQFFISLHSLAFDRYIGPAQVKFLKLFTAGARGLNFGQSLYIQPVKQQRLW